jgi:hypothetical protein
VSGVKLLRSVCVRSAAAATVLAGLTVACAADAKYPTCHIHKSKDVHFQNGRSKDVLEVSIGTGPCYSATLSVIIRSEFGTVLYSYVAPFKRHVVTHWADRRLAADATNFVDDLVANGMRPTSELPVFQEPEDFNDETNGEIQVPRSVYEKLRLDRRSMIFHLTGYETWQYAFFDESAEKSVIVIIGGS